MWGMSVNMSPPPAWQIFLQRKATRGLNAPRVESLPVTPTKCESSTTVREGGLLTNRMQMPLSLPACLEEGVCKISIFLGGLFKKKREGREGGEGR